MQEMELLPCFPLSYGTENLSSQCEIRKAIQGNIVTSLLARIQIPSSFTCLTNMTKKSKNDLYVGKIVSLSHREFPQAFAEKIGIPILHTLLTGLETWFSDLQSL